MCVKMFMMFNFTDARKTQKVLLMFKYKLQVIFISKYSQFLQKNRLSDLNS